jgi:hypothetical protein
MVAYKDGDRVQLISHQGKDHTRRFPELADAIKALRFRTLVRRPCSCRCGGSPIMGSRPGSKYWSTATKGSSPRTRRHLTSVAGP